MINLKGKRQSLYKKGKGHQWRVLEEILACTVAFDDKIVNKSSILENAYAEAKLDSISISSLTAKMANYNALRTGGKFGNCNDYSKEVNDNYDTLKPIYDDVFYNSWKKFDKSKGIPDIFETHDIQLLFSKSYLLSKYSSQLALDISYFECKINQYLQNIFIHTTPQHYIEHANAIGLLDKIIIVTKDEMKVIAEGMNPDCYNTINDYMGLFIASNNSLDSYFDKSGISVKLCNNDSIIFLCPEIMDEICSLLKNNHPILNEMIDIVFSHEIGHLAFYFYLGNCLKNKAYTLREKQANWISSIAHNGTMDDIIEEVTVLQSSQYHNPVLLKQKSQTNYYNKVEDLYLR